MYRNSNIGAREGDNRGGLAGEWWDGQKIFHGAEDLSNFLSLARGFSDSTVDCEIRLDYSGRVCDLGEEVCWKVGQRQLASSPPPPWVHQVNVCARVVHLKYMPKKSSPRLS